MLTHISFENFKSWASLKMPFGSVTGIFGPNSSGKTSIIQFLLLLKQTREATDRAIVLELNGNYVELGSIRDAVHKHDESKEVSWALVFRPPDWGPSMVIKDSSDPEPSEIVRGETLALASTVVIVNNAPATQSLSYEFGDIKFELAPQSDKPAAFDLKASTWAAGRAPLHSNGQRAGLGRCRVQSNPTPSQIAPEAPFKTRDFLPIWSLAMKNRWIDSIIWAHCATSPGGTICGRAHDLLT